MSRRRITETASAQSRTARPALSIAIPFYGDDPAPLLARLCEQCGPDEEIILFDDGAPDRAAAERLSEGLDDCGAPVRLIASPVNLGRSAARNHLARAARGDWILYLDADMSVPDGFLARWRKALDGAEFDAAFGGYDLPEQIARSHRLHAGLARAGDLHDAAARARIGASAVCSSNLAARRELMLAVAFDEGFEGWGWEDVDWAVRAGAAAWLVHVDIPACHGGLQTASVLLAKYAQGGANYARFLARHPHMAALPGAKAARVIARARMIAPARALSGIMARIEALPVRARVLAMKVYKAACAAQALKRARS